MSIEKQALLPDVVSGLLRDREPAASFTEAVQAAASRQLRSEALRRAGYASLLGLGLGAGARGLLGMHNLSKKKKKEKLEDESAVLPEIPIYSKQSNFLSGQYATSVSGVPWAMPAAVGGASLGAIGGWKFLDYLLDKRRRQALDRELELAKEEYEKALRSKSSSTLSQELDRLYDNTIRVKSSMSWGDLLGRLAGVYGVYALGSGALGGVFGYNYGKSKQRKTIIDEAQKMRARERMMRQPPPIVAVPAEEEEEENNTRGHGRL